MINSINLYGTGFPNLSKKHDQQLALLALGAYVLVSWLWVLIADAPWDDDVPTRFFNTQNAFSNPENFVSLWNRPLFVIIFAIPAQLGTVAVTILMPLFAALGAFLLWKSLLERKVPFAWLVIPLFLFQPFFFGTSRVALTEPLAATLIAAAFYFHGKGKWWAFALMGGLLPLARLELSPLLMLWLPTLIKEKQWKSILILGFPMLLWNVLAGIITGDFLYVVNQSFGADNTENRYGHTPFLHYFERIGYVTGPIVLFLSIQGIFSRILEKRANLWLDFQLLCGFALYVIFSWKLNMGNSAGFLRNLVPLTPFWALLSLDGWNSAMATIAVNGNDSSKNEKRNYAVLGLSGLIALMLGLFVFGYDLRVHQILDPVPNYSISMGIVLGFGVLVYLLLSRKRPSFSQKAMYASSGFALLAIAYTLYTEPPSISNNSERQAIKIIADSYLESGMKSQPTYANHYFFFWCTGLNPDSPKFRRITQKSLLDAPIGSIIIWDLHYSTRLIGDVTPDFMQSRPEFVEMLRIGLPDRKVSVVLYQKSSTDAIAQENLSKKFFEMNPNHLPAITGRVFNLIWHGRYQEAISLATNTLAKVPNDPDLWFAKGFAAHSIGDAQTASVAFENCVNIYPNFSSAWYNLGMARKGLNNDDGAMQALSNSINLDQEFADAWFARGALNGKLGLLEAAVDDFSHAIAIDRNNFGYYFNRAVTYSMLKRPQLALADINLALAIQSNNLEALFVKGRIEIQAGKKTDGCLTLQKALAAGFEKAAEFIEKNCAEQN